VAEIDSSLLKGHDEIEKAEQEIKDDLLSYYDFASQLGFHPEVRTGLGPDAVEELKGICLGVAETFPKEVFFAGKLVWDTEVEGFIARFLHNHTAIELQNWLQLYGLSLVILPIRIGPQARRQLKEGLARQSA